MENIFTLENISDFSERLNIDELYEKKRQYDLNKLDLFNKILNRVHIRIKTTSRQKMDEQFCWFVVPEIIIGVPKYDQAACIAYIMDKLKENGFTLRYIHPNTLFISWASWVPSYVRSELKKKTGIIINEYGKKIGIGEDEDERTLKIDNINPDEMMFNFKDQDNNNSNLKQQQQQKKFTPVTSYKPSGNFLYTDDLLNKIGDKFS